MSESMIRIARRILTRNLGLHPEEQLLVIGDEATQEIAAAFFQAGTEVGARAALVHIQPLGQNGAEPVPVVAQAMAAADVVVAATAHSLTHTQARKKACAAGARVVTMPGITREMFVGGAMTADYEKVAARARRLAEKLTRAKEAVIEKGGFRLRLSLAGRQGVASTGLYQDKGSGGNLPSGEAYIAPVEGTAEGEIVIDGSFAGIGRLSYPLKLIFAGGLLVKSEGPDSSKLWKLLGENPLARNLAELGIGTNDGARLCGNILEDEKVYGTVHIALGSNDTFGGQVAAGIHLDGVILEPKLYLDEELVIESGRLILD